MHIQKFLIAGGNPTALVQDCPLSLRKTMTAALLREVEQVGFIDPRNIPPGMEMMGGEFCINATLGFSATLEKSGRVSVSGLKQSVAYRNDKGRTTISVPISWSISGNIVLLEGIGFILRPATEHHRIEKEELAAFCAAYKLPAFGAIFYDRDRITPYVHVPAANSFVRETACGSGSVAFSVFSGIKRVVQPTGQAIMINGQDIFEIAADVEIIR